MFNGELLVMGAKQALSTRTGVTMTGTAAEIFAKKDVLRAAAARICCGTGNSKSAFAN
jgi:hypothetical protein